MKVRNNISVIVFILGLMLAGGIGNSCTPLGETAIPLNNDLFRPLVIEDSLRVSRDFVDFANGENIYFSAKFSALVDYNITITGEFTGNKDTIVGKAKELGPNNTTWRGLAIRPPSFGVEPVKAVLTFPNRPEVDSMVVRFRVTGGKSDEGLYIPIASFEGAEYNGFGRETGQGRGFGFDIARNGPNGAFESRAELTREFGGTVFRMRGTDLDGNWYIGNVSIGPNNMNGANARVFPLETRSPGRVFFNFYIFSPIADNRLIVEIALTEDFDPRDSAREQYQNQNFINFTGWRLISIPLSNFNKSSGGNGGNGVFDVDRINRVEMKVLSNGGNNGRQLTAVFDNPCFTLSQPLVYRKDRQQ